MYVIFSLLFFIVFFFMVIFSHLLGCGFCMNFLPTYERLGELLSGYKDNLTIGLFDTSQNDVPYNLKISGQPDVLFFPKHESGKGMYGFCATKNVYCVLLFKTLISPPQLHCVDIQKHIRFRGARSFVGLVKFLKEHCR